jgi:AsmA protein
VKKHPLISILVAIVVLLLVAVLLIPLFVNANTFRPTLESQLSSALGRKVTLGELSFSIVAGSLVADNISIADNPAFSPKPFLQAKSLHIGVEVGPLVFHKQLLVKNLVADSPSINLVHNAQGTWNFSDIGKTAGSRRAPCPTSPSGRCGWSTAPQPSPTSRSPGLPLSTAM